MEKLIVDLPPSINRGWAAVGPQRFVHTKEYSDYINDTAWVVKAYCMKNRIDPIAWYRHVDMDWYLDDVRYDSHNGKKALCDALERGGLFKNDRYIMDRTQSVQMGVKDARVEITVAEA